MLCECKITKIYADCCEYLNFARFIRHDDTANKGRITGIFGPFQKKQ